MPRRCVVAGCSKSTNDGVSLHTFPKDDATRKIWISRIKLTRAQWDGPSAHSTVCSDHFREEDFESQGLYVDLGFTPKKKMLRPTAIPVIKLGTAGCGTGSQTQGAEKQSRSAVLKRESLEKKRLVEEVLHHEKEEQTDPDLKLESPQLTDVPHPQCSCWYDSEEPTASQENFPTVIKVIKETVGISASTQTTETAVETKVKRIQVSVSTCEKGTQCELVIAIDSGTQCNIEKEEESERKEKALRKEEAERNEDKGKESSSDSGQSGRRKRCQDSDYIPESEASSDAFSTPQKPRKKMRVGRQPAKEVHLNTCKEPIHQEPKFIVFQGPLLQLFKECRHCHSGLINVTKRVVGSMVIVCTECYSCNQHSRWESQPKIRNRPAGNILIPAATLFAGGSYVKILRIFQSIGIATVCRPLYYHFQRVIFQPVVERRWKEEQEAIVSELKARSQPLVIAGDGRADSPGHSAKYGLYTGLETSVNKIVDVQLLQSNECKNSNHMELEGLKRFQSYLASEDLKMGKLVTDRHRQIAKHMREQSPDVCHAFDVWHVAKAVHKKIHALAQQKGCEELMAWEQSIGNHVYWVAASTKDEEGDMREAKWLSLVNHIQDIHEGHSEVFPSCLHGDLSDKPKKWLKSGTKAAEKLDDIVTNKTLVKDIKKLSSGQQTSSLESFHSIVNRFAPKMNAYKYHGILARVQLAALHYNMNSDRKQATSSSGELLYHISKPKYKPGSSSAKARKEPRRYSYVDDLLSAVVEYDDRIPAPRQPSPPPLVSAFEYPPREEVIDHHRSRFASGE